LINSGAAFSGQPNESMFARIAGGGLATADAVRSVSAQAFHVSALVALAKWSYR